jgi:hypothetical protein
VLLSVSGCAGFVREVKVPRSALATIAADGSMVVEADGSAVRVRATCVTPVASGLAPTSHRFSGTFTAWNALGRCEGSPGDYADVAARWSAQPQWREAEVRFVAQEPTAALLIPGGAVAGTIVGGLTGAWATRCEGRAEGSCEDAGAVSVLGTFLGAGVGALAGMYVGWELHDLTAPRYGAAR